MGQNLEKGKQKELEDYILQKEKNSMLSKDIKVNYPIGDDIRFDDFYRVSQFRQPYKVCEIHISKDKRSNYITGLQFIYSSLQTPPLIIKGNIMGNNDAFSSKYDSKKFTLKEDEYIIELKGRNGMILDRFGVVTSLNNNYYFGGSGGGEFSHKVPQGFHFNNFGAYFSVGWGNISSFTADIQSIDTFSQKSPLNDKIQSWIIKKPIFRSIIGYLKIKEIANLFLVNKQFSQQRYDDYVVGQLGLRCIFSCNPNLSSYMNQIKKNCLTSAESFERYTYYQEICPNIVQNPSGEQGLQEYQTSGSVKPRMENNIHFFSINSYGQTKFEWKYDLEKNLTNEQRKNICLGKLAFVAGAQIAESGYGTQGALSIVVTYENGSKKSCIQNLYGLTRDLISYSIIYRKISETNELPTKVEFQIKIQENSCWESRVRSISFRLFPFEYEHEINLLKTFSKGSIFQEVENDDNIY